MKLLVYSHDTFGLGNIRRMLAICAHLRSTVPDLSVLIISGSPMLQSFRVQEGIDYIKLPCLKRSESGDLGVRFLDLEVEQIVRLRRELILSTIMSFEPDVVLVDKKPEGLAGEMEPALRYIKCHLPQTRIMLVLRDILDAPARTISAWANRGCYNTVQWYYDDVLVLGSREVFDACSEYHFPRAVRAKVRFCGYVARIVPGRSREEMRRHLSISEEEKLVLVTTGGGEDGFHILSASLEAVRQISQGQRVRGVIVAGPELAAESVRQIHAAARSCAGVQVVDFVEDMMSYMNAADVVISMAGYNTVCELLTLGKKAVLIPRTKPVEEQRIRVERMGHVPFFSTILPDKLTPDLLAAALTEQLHTPDNGISAAAPIDLGALPRISDMLASAAPHCAFDSFESASQPMTEMVA